MALITPKEARDLADSYTILRSIVVNCIEDAATAGRTDTDYILHCARFQYRDSIKRFLRRKGFKVGESRRWPREIILHISWEE